MAGIIYTKRHDVKTRGPRYKPQDRVCANCGKKSKTVFANKSTKDPNKGKRICGGCKAAEVGT